jgi:tetratricopeptide (TPR) repeat protein|tara:strand:+ start:14170 stop:16623 length:2454 start_codon:yes stop_codon:yes gene_type:complete
MIKIDAVHIEEFRGIRKLDIVLNGKTFAVSGPNGSGKSGVIDAIEFGLTGQIRRLTGTGTRGLTIADHGPHVDRTKFPDAAFVVLDLVFPTLGKTAKLTRKVSAPRKPKIEPQDADILAIMNRVAQHPEVTLARREILKFILVEPAKRSEEIQAILKIEELGQTRSALNSAYSKLNRQATASASETQAKRATLLQHLSIAALSAREMLTAVNAKRKLLGLAEHAELNAETVLDEGLSEPSGIQALNKTTALTELINLTDMITDLQANPSVESAALVAQIERLETDPQLLRALQQRALVEQGLGLVDGPECPMCDHEWPDEAHLRGHLQTKQERSKTAGLVRIDILDQAAALSTTIGRLKALLLEAHAVAKAERETKFQADITAWGKDLAELQKQLESFEQILTLKDRLTTGWPAHPEGFDKALADFTALIRAKPDQSATVAAQTFLINAQQRFEDYKTARKEEATTATARDAAKVAYDAWCAAMETELDALYDAVQDDFSKFYRVLNDGDEEKFVARLKASEGKLDFDVNFYERGLFPPGAFHSEGHQDGMGVCLYLALMKRLLAEDFTISLLDDVVMSVDAGHRYQFCRLLMAEFPETQFVIATHDRLWAEQMRSAKLVSRNTSMSFHGWTVESGPMVEANVDIWNDIDQALAKGKIETAAHSLRRHMEFVSRLLADQLGARPVFKADGNYDLGDLLPSSMSRLKELLGKAVDAAQSWGNTEMQQTALMRKKLLSQANAAKGDEDWAVNKAVHHNDWANFGKSDFEPVVEAFKDLLACAQCDDCGSWLYITPKHSAPESLRCACNGVNMNLKRKTG